MKRTPSTQSFIFTYFLILAWSFITVWSVFPHDWPAHPRLLAMLGNKNSISSKFQPILKSPQSYKMSFMIEIFFCGHWHRPPSDLTLWGSRTWSLNSEDYQASLGGQRFLSQVSWLLTNGLFLLFLLHLFLAPLYWLSDRVYDIKQHLFMNYYRFMTKI